MQKRKANFGQQSSDELDRILDIALATYTAVEPRTGLEGRILAHLKGNPRKAIWQRSWSLAVALAVAALAVVVILDWHWSKRQVVFVGPTRVGQANVVPKQLQGNRLGSQPRSEHTRRESNRSAAPKRNRFPSTRPLSDEEKLLVRYVRDFPKDAVLIAKAQTESEKEIEALVENRPEDEKLDGAEGNSEK